MTEARLNVRKLVATVLVCALAGLPLAANAVNISVNDARKLVDDVGKQALSVIDDAKLSKPQKKAKLENIFSSNVDIAWVGRFVLGRYWRQAEEPQRKRYLKEYENFLVTHYAGRFADYTGGSYKVTNATEDGDDQFTVTMEMLSPDKQQVNVDYRLHKTDDGKLKMFDVIVEGVSLIATQRSEFASVLSQNNLDYLIEQLSNKTLKITTTAKKD